MAAKKLEPHTEMWGTTANYTSVWQHVPPFSLGRGELEDSYKHSEVPLQSIVFMDMRMDGHPAHAERERETETKKGALDIQ